MFAFNHSKMQVKGDNGWENVDGQIVSGIFSCSGDRRRSWADADAIGRCKRRKSGGI